MRKLNLPEEHIDAFVQLAQMAQSEFEGILLKKIISLGDLEISQSVNELFTRISKTEGDEKAILTSIFSMLMTIAKSGEADDKFWPALVNSLPEKKFDAELKSTVEKRLKHVYSASEGIRCLMKANFLIDESEHIFFESKVITDIRPVFQNDTAELRGPYAVIIHKLKLVRQDGDGFKDIFISMTHEQLKELQKQIERAVDKENHLRKRGQFTYLS